jgi:protein SCO1/2
MMLRKHRMHGLAAGLALLATLLLAGCGGSGGSDAAGATGARTKPSELTDHSDQSYAGLGLTPPQPRPQFSLTDTAGRPYKFGTATAGKPTLLYFGYTHCPDVCPTTLADIALALQAVPAPVRQATQVVFVTTDVKRDRRCSRRTWRSSILGCPTRSWG